MQIYAQHTRQAAHMRLHHSMSSHTRTPSIDLRTFAVEAELSDDGLDSSALYTGSVEDGRFDPAAYLAQALGQALDAASLDAALVSQARTSGEVRSRQLELDALVEEVEQLTTAVLARCADVRGVVGATRKELKACQRAVDRLDAKVQEKWPIEYEAARDKVVGREELELEA